MGALQPGSSEAKELIEGFVEDTGNSIAASTAMVRCDAKRTPKSQSKKGRETSVGGAEKPYPTKGQIDAITAAGVKEEQIYDDPKTVQEMGAPLSPSGKANEVGPRHLKRLSSILGSAYESPGLTPRKTERMTLSPTLPLVVTEFH